MSTFKSNSRFEVAHIEWLLPKIAPLFAKKNLLVTWNVRSEQTQGVTDGVARHLQKEVGDFVVYDVSSFVPKLAYSVDLKAERTPSENMFFETYSNCSLDPALCKPGWGVTLQADRIWYTFHKVNALTIFDFPKLKGWLGEWIKVPGRGGREKETLRLLSYPERPQMTHKQQNVTVGRLIPFRDIPDAVWLSTIILDEDGARKGTRDEFLERVRAVKQDQPVPGPEPIDLERVDGANIRPPPNSCPNDGRVRPWHMVGPNRRSA